MRKSVATAALVLASITHAGPVTGYLPGMQHEGVYTPEFEPTEDYLIRRHFGFTIMVSGRLYEREKAEVDKMLQIIRAQLARITYIVPLQEVRKLRKIKIWITDRTECGTRALAEYHVDERWLIDHGRNPDMAKSVEFCKTEAYLRAWPNRPGVIMHELTHGYHDQFMPDGYDNKSVIDAYNLALSVGRYSYVLHTDGRYREAYAATNRFEYIAEVSSAFFGTNNSYPFVNVELKQYDPDGYRAAAEGWIRTERLSCSRESTVKTQHRDFSVELTSVNRTDETRRVQWIDHHGKRREDHTDELPAGETRRRGTYAGHAWIVLAPDDTCLDIYVMGAADEEIEITR